MGARLVFLALGSLLEVVVVDMRRVPLVAHNLTVEGAETYFVGDAEDAVWVHNCGDDITPYARNKYKDITPKEKRKVKSEEPICVYCGEKPSVQVDHIRSQKQDWIEGGYKDTRQVRSDRVRHPSNLAGACEGCNLSKGSKELRTQGSKDKAGQWTPPKDRKDERKKNDDSERE